METQALPILIIPAYPGSKSLAPLFDDAEAKAGVTNSPYPANSVSTRIGNVSVRQLRGIDIIVTLSILNFKVKLVVLILFLSYLILSHSS